MNIKNIKNIKNINGQAQIIVLLILVSIAGVSYTFLGKSNNRQVDVDSLYNQHYLKQLNNRILVRLSHEPYCTQAFGGNSQSKNYNSLSVLLDSGETDLMVSTINTWKYRNGIKVKSIKTRSIDNKSTELEVTYIMPSASGDDEQREITRKLILKSELDTTSLITSCVADDSNVVSEAVEKLCKGPGAFINSDGRCVLTGSITNYCPSGQQAQGFTYENGVYVPKCKTLGMNSLSNVFIYDVNVGENCETKNLKLRRIGGRLRLRCAPGTAISCNSDGGSCTPCCADGLSCNTDTNLCEQSSCNGIGGSCSPCCDNGLSCNSQTNLCESAPPSPCNDGASCTDSSSCGSGNCVGMGTSNLCVQNTNHSDYNFGRCVGDGSNLSNGAGCRHHDTSNLCAQHSECSWIVGGTGDNSWDDWCQEVTLIPCDDPYSGTGASAHHKDICKIDSNPTPGTCSC